MIYGFMFLAALSTAMMSYEMTLTAQSFWSVFFIVASIACWALSGLSIDREIRYANKQIEDFQKKIEELEKHYDDKKN